MRPLPKRGPRWRALLMLLVLAGAASAEDGTFTVTDIRVEGLQRIA